MMHKKKGFGKASSPPPPRPEPAEPWGGAGRGGAAVRRRSLTVQVL